LPAAGLSRGALALGVVAALFGFGPAAAHGRHWRTGSPDGKLTAIVEQPRARAALRLIVRRAGRPSLSCRLGLETSAGQLAEGLRFTGRRDAHWLQTYAALSGKRRLHRRRAKQMTLSFLRGGRRLQVQVQVSDDGVAYRYGLPGRGSIRIRGEHSSFDAPAGSRAWMQRYTTSYEGPYTPARLRGAPAGRYAFPVLVELPGRSWALLSESGVTGRYAASHLALGFSHRGRLALRLPGGQVRARLPLVTPWRVAVVGDLATVVESDLTDDLGGPSRIADTSWIRPGRAAWSWWSEPSSTQSLERQEQYVDFAAAMGWEYVIVDAGWSPTWMPMLASYARARGVGILLWARASDLRSRRQRRSMLDLWRSWGIAGVKLDYVQSDSQQTMAWYERVSAAAAARHLLVDFHGATLPRGIQHRWPNVLTAEAVMGAEYYHTGEPVTPAHTTTLPFTRNAVGPMDYTPVTFSATTRTTSLAHELALSVVFESGLQVFADSPVSYDSQPAARDFLRQVPAAWDDTRFLGGYPGRSATLARRRGRDWFVGSISSGRAATVTTALRFLDPRRSYRATLVTDSGGGLALQQRTVTRDSILKLSLVENGGAVVRLAVL
jgi:alpha-glucosidase